MVVACQQVFDHLLYSDVCDQLAPSSVGVPVSGEHGPDVGDEPEGVEDGEEVEQGGVRGVVEPRLDRYGIVWREIAGYLIHYLVTWPLLYN